MGDYHPDVKNNKAKFGESVSIAANSPGMSYSKAINQKEGDGGKEGRPEERSKRS